MNCPHGSGLGHLIADITMALPFIPIAWFWLKSKLKRKKI